jgi:UDP-N-acetylglucosamine acyltransferase
LSRRPDPTRIPARSILSCEGPRTDKSMSKIHPSAIVDPRAELAEDVQVGAYSIIKVGVKIGSGTVVQENCHIHGITVIGRNCVIGPGAYVGLAPQHLKLQGENGFCIIGDNVIIRETATVHRSIYQGEEHATRVGDRCMLMAGSHVAHDCLLGEDVILANAVLLGGHVTLGNRAFIGGGATLHQHVRIGRLAIIAGNEALGHDCPPFGAVRYGGLKGYNAIGCKRAGLSREVIASIRAAYHCLLTTRTMPKVLEKMRQLPPVPELTELMEFISQSKRGILPSVHFLKTHAWSVTD